MKWKQRMQEKWNRLWVVALAGVALALVAMAAFAGEPLPIIPGASGFGMETVAGSGRHLDVPKTRVIKVTNLNPSGPGSLRAALEAESPRVVIFEIIVSDVRNGRGKIIASQKEVGGWPKLAENHRKLTLPENPDGDGDGYTNLEEWLHGFAAEVEGRGK